MREGKRPIAVGFFFSLGHSTVVIIATILIALTASSVQQRFPGLLAIAALTGTLVSVLFLFTIAMINVVVLAGVEASKGLSIWSIMVFPALFTAGMSLIDTSDGVLMVGAYGWAFMNPVGKLYYNLTITGMSVVVAVVVGAIEALGLVAKHLEILAGILGSVEIVVGQFDTLGYLVVGVFLASWLVSFVICRARSYEKIGSV